MDISINSGKYVKKSDFVELAKAIQKLSRAIDYQEDVLEFYGQYLSDLFSSACDYNELLLRDTQEAIRTILSGKQLDIFEAELKTHKDLLDEQFSGRPEKIQKEFLAKIRESQKRHGLEETTDGDLFPDK